MRHVIVIIRKDDQTKYNRPVPEWEIPLLEHIFGEEGQVEVTDEYVPAVPIKGIELDQYGYPLVGPEFVRLQSAYGRDKTTKKPVAIEIFGNGHAGRKALGKLMEQARIEEQAAKPKKRKLLKKVPRELAQDPLLA